MTFSTINMLQPKIFTGSGCVAGLEACVKNIMPSHVFIVTDSVVGPLYSQKLQGSLQRLGVPVSVLTFGAGEAYKTRKTKELLEDQMLEAAASRQACVIALGGGIVLDVAGYLASTYARGVPLVLVPTSLLAMVDACIGGKTAVNTPQGKNLIGTFYQPEAVFVDINFLSSLPQDEFKNGVVEMIKHALILDEQYFDFLESHAQAILAQEPSILEEAIHRSLAIKASIVAQDEKEAGIRRLLNFGHTVGHAIEAASAYSIPHGRAVALGILAEGMMSVQMGHLQQQELDRIKQLFIAYGIDLTHDFVQDDLYSIMCMDKKSHQGAPRIVVLEKIGAALHCNGAFCQKIPSKNT